MRRTTRLASNRSRATLLVGFLAIGLAVTSFTLGTAGGAGSGNRASSPSADDWPQFHGPNCSGANLSARNLPVNFSSTENVAWSVEVGDGVGSPVVAAGRVFTAGMRDDETVVLYCFEAATGNLLWERVMATGPLAEIHATNSHASTTPAADQDRVYFYFSTLGLMAFDARTGERVWQVDLPVPYFVFKWGPGMSPVLYGDVVLFCQDDDLNPALYAFDKRTGKQLWKADRGDMAVNYSHPVVAETEHGPEVVVAGTGKLIGYDLETGEELWFAHTLLRNIKTTPVVHDGIVYLSLQSSGIANQWLATADADSDGRLTKAEIQGFVGEVPVPEAFFKKFDRGDVNGDGYLVGEELDKAFLAPDNFAGAAWNAENPANQAIQAIRAGGRGDVTATHVLWNHENRAPDHIVSPLVADGRMYVVKGGGLASCFDIADGKPIWYLRRIQNPSEYFASPIYGDGKIYIAAENGYVVVLENGPELKVLAKNDMGESILGTPAIAEGRLFIRTRGRLYCVADLPSAAK